MSKDTDTLAENHKKYTVKCQDTHQHITLLSVRKDRRATTASTLLSPSYLLSASALALGGQVAAERTFLSIPERRQLSAGEGGFAARARCDVTDSEGVVGRRPRRYSVR